MPLKKVHHIWFQGEANLPRSAREAVRDSRNMNPYWEHHLWDEQKLRDLCYRFSARCGQTFDAYPLMHQKIDLGRYVVLYFHGGITLDTDAVCIQSFDTVDFPTESVLFTELDLSWIERCVSGLWNNATIYSPYPGHTTIRTLIEKILEQGIGPSWFPRWLRIYWTTGPYRFQKVVSNLSGYESAPGPLFEPCVLRDCNITKDTVVYHCHEGSWVDFPYREMIQFYAAFRKPVKWLIESILLLMLFLAFATVWSLGRTKSR